MAEGIVRLPADIAGSVSFVGGLSDAPVATHGAQPASSGPSGGESPSALITADSMGNTISSEGGGGKSVGLLEFDGFKQSDIDAFTQQFSLPSITRPALRLRLVRPTRPDHRLPDDWGKASLRLDDYWNGTTAGNLVDL